MRQATTRGLYQYWNTVRGGRLAPRRYEIEPSQIIPFLSETMIIEQPATDTCRIRVAGTRVCDTLGSNLRGQPFYDLWNLQDQTVVSDNVGTIAQFGAVGLFTFSGELVEEQPAAEFEMLLLPLTHLEDRIERVLGSISLTSSPDWLATQPPTRLRLTSNEIIWPDGRPHGLSVGQQSRFYSKSEVPSLKGQTGIRRARLIRRERRSFLVYDGGLTETANRNDA